MKLTTEQIKKMIREEMGVVDNQAVPGQEITIAVKKMVSMIKGLATPDYPAENIIGDLINYGEFGQPILENKKK